MVTTWSEVSICVCIYVITWKSFHFKKSPGYKNVVQNYDLEKTEIPDKLNNKAESYDYRANGSSLQPPISLLNTFSLSILPSSQFVPLERVIKLLKRKFDFIYCNECTSLVLGNGDSFTLVQMEQQKKQKTNNGRAQHSTTWTDGTGDFHTAGQVNVNFATAKLNWYVCEGGRHTPPLCLNFCCL